MNILIWIVLIFVILIVGVIIYYYYSENLDSTSIKFTVIPEDTFEVIRYDTRKNHEISYIYKLFEKIAKSRIKTLKQNKFYYLSPVYDTLWNDCFTNISEQKMKIYSHFERTKDSTHKSVPVIGGQLARGKFQIDNTKEEEFLLKEIQKIFPSCRFSGYFYYPNKGFREWHTNDINVDDGRSYDWRVYLVYANKDGESGTRTRNLPSKKFSTYKDKRYHMNIFKLGKYDRWWHCIYSKCDRVSLGLHLSDNDMKKLFQMINSN